MSLRGPNKNLHPTTKVSRDGLVIPDSTFFSQKTVPTHGITWPLSLGIHDRLFTHHTLNSIRKSYCLDERDIIPNDSLDFALSSIYVHSEDYNVPKSYVFMQPETLNNQAKNLPKYVYNISSGQSRIDNVRSKNGEAMSLMERKFDEPRILTSIPLTSINKSKMEKCSSNFTNVNKKNENVSNHTESINKILHEHYDRLSARNKYAKLSSNKTLASGLKYSRKHVKVGASTHERDQLPLVKNNATIVWNKNVVGATPMRRQDIAQDEMENDVLDKTQRRETYAAQMRAIERIHPSSLRLAVDGPHSDQTNPGYSRKIDGTFYGI